MQFSESTKSVSNTRKTKVYFTQFVYWLVKLFIKYSIIYINYWEVVREILFFSMFFGSSVA